MTYGDYINEELIEKTYLYAYNKLHSQTEAEDLSQDILTEALTALHRGVRVGAFYPWFWALAHNRWCAYLSRRNRTPYTVSLEGGQVVGAADTALPLDEELMLHEEISELNFAVSRLSREHREAVVMYYLRGMKIADIARVLGIPEGTVKRRLFDAKQNIRKGIENMPNNTGRSAYAPAEFNKWGGYGAPTHWNAISDPILDQIFVVCRSGPKSVVEIADEVGVAPVYLEKIMEYPLEHGFLKKTPNGRILTDFVVQHRQVSYDIQHAVGKVYADIGPEIHDVLMRKKDFITSLDFYGNDFDYGYLLWILYVFACARYQDMALKANEARWAGRVAENNGKDYRIAASFAYPQDKLVYTEPIKQQVCWSNLHEHFENEKYGRVTYVNFYQAEPFGNRDGLINASNAQLLAKIYESGGDCALNKVEAEQAAHFIRNGVVIKNGDRLKINIPAMSYKQDDEIRTWLSDMLDPIVEKYVDKITAAADRIVLPHIREDLMEEYAHWILQGYFFPVNFVFYWAMHEGKTLALPAGYSSSAAGLYLKIR